MFPSYNIVTPTWTFPINPGNDTFNGTVVFNGTIEHAMIQIEEALPGWRKTYDEHLMKNPLEKRWGEDYWGKNYHCNVVRFNGQC